MRAQSSIAIATAAWLLILAGACSLNPQPLPPAAPEDGSGGTTSADGGNDSTTSDSSAGGDSGFFGDASNDIDTGPNPPPGDAGDAASDGGDAAHDAPDGD